MNKFRVWDKEKSKYVTSHFWVINANGELGYSGLSCVSYGKENRFIVEWYTGLKDKNAKEIYDGDIAEIKSKLIRIKDNKTMDKLSIKRIIIFWETRKSAFRYEEIYNNRIERDLNAEKIKGDLYENITSEYFEIIGNIRENKELLEGNNEM